METLAPAVKAIKAEMERRELRAYELAKLADVSMPNLYAILKGEVAPNLDTLGKLAAALKMKVTAQ